VRLGLRARSEYWSRADGDTVQSSSGKHRGAQLGVVAAKARWAGGWARQKVALSSGLPSPCRRRRREKPCSMRFSLNFFGRPHVSSTVQDIACVAAQDTSHCCINAFFSNPWSLLCQFLRRTSFPRVPTICIHPYMLWLLVSPHISSLTCRSTASSQVLLCFLRPFHHSRPSLEQ